MRRKDTTMLAAKLFQGLIRPDLFWSLGIITVRMDFFEKIGAGEAVDGCARGHLPQSSHVVLLAVTGI